MSHLSTITVALALLEVIPTAFAAAGVLGVPNTMRVLFRSNAEIMAR
eukprot:CAMPEP_0182563824 /NCGR_PEP_ID=MMETSP1324-20130603/5898_1 /TAXON_ID=236786 /ORGANISM="Florenciella sp., Strain RCC1587" /LENGTH=46 /DNA_ID= /DNA_START= /DNA_END= /DNA_ORIENTATION=